MANTEHEQVVAEAEAILRAAALKRLYGHSRPFHYRLVGHEAVPCVGSVVEWAREYETLDRRVEETTIGDWCVSTVFLGLDHCFTLDPTAPPILFETMVFTGPMHGETWRYSTWDEAAAGHAKVVAQVRALWEQSHRTQRDA